MREKILTLLERNSRMTAEEIAVLLGSSSEVIAGEIRKRRTLSAGTIH